MPVKIFIVDDHPMVLEGITGIINQYAHLEITGKFGLGRVMLDAIELSSPDLILADIQIPDFDGAKLVQLIRKTYPHIKILAISSNENPYIIKEVLQNGASGYILKSTDPETLIQAIDTVVSGSEFIDIQIKDLLLRSFVLNNKPESSDYIKLTKREQEILNLIGEGITNIEIASKLYLSIRTIENHRLAIYQKFNVNNAGMLIKAALKKGFL